MVKAIDLASDLRKLARYYEQLGEVELVEPRLTFHSGNSREEFIASAKALPHPINKKWPQNPSSSVGYDIIRFNHQTGSIHVEATTWFCVTCKLVEPARPARYECDELVLTAEEEEYIQD